MKRIKRRLIVALLFLSVIFLFTLLDSFFRFSKLGTVSNKQAVLSPIPTQIIGITSNPSKCHLNGVLPDPDCTPGVIDPSVTQENLFQTICVKGYTVTVRPPVEFTNRLKRLQIADYGYTDTNMHDYEEDHLISLELGGAPSDPKNLWPEPGFSPNAKDKIENMCHEKVCSGTISLQDAQREISTDWPTACQ